MICLKCSSYTFQSDCSLESNLLSNDDCLYTNVAILPSMAIGTGASQWVVWSYVSIVLAEYLKDPKHSTQWFNFKHQHCLPRWAQGWASACWGGWRQNTNMHNAQNMHNIHNKICKICQICKIGKIYRFRKISKYAN